MRMSIRVQKHDFNVALEIAAMRDGNRSIGAIASFIGLMRDFNEGENVISMTLEHYSGMTEKALQIIANNAISRWEIIDVTIIHRLGNFAPGDQIVLVMVASAHRAAAFAACEFIMDLLKTRAPFWKKETTPDGERWVDARASDDEATSRWDV